MKEENFQNYEHEYLFTHAKICSLSRATTLKARIYIKKKKTNQTTHSVSFGAQTNISIKTIFIFR